MLEEDPLGLRVRTLFMDLAHAGELSPTAAGGAEVYRTGEAGRIAEGTRVRFGLRLSGARVVQVRYRAYGCPYTLATCEWLARRLSGRQLKEASVLAITGAVGAPPEWAEVLGVPPERLGRLLVVEDALRQAMEGPEGPEGPKVITAVQHNGRANPSDQAMTDSG